MKIVWMPTSSAVVRLNKLVCEAEDNPHQVVSPDRIESAIHSAFYPGSAPFAAGGIARIAGALAFYLTKGHAFQDGNKRTAVLTAVTFMNQHGWDLQYPVDELKDINALAEITEACAAGTVGKDELMEWYDSHKTET